jgi:hypothetical protein
MFNDRYLPRSEKDSFFKILETLNNNEEKFNEIRSMFEVILKRMNKTDLYILPDELFNSHGGPIFENVIAYLGKKVPKENSDESNKVSRVVPDHIFYSLRFIKDTTSAFSHHSEYKKAHHSNKACIMALVECMHHLKQMIDDRK